MGLFGVACIFSTLVTIDGPLLQRATRAAPAAISGQTVSLNVTIAPEIPQYYAGNWYSITKMGGGPLW